MSYKFQKGDAKLGGAIEASQLTGTLKPSSLADATTDDIAEGSSAQYYTDARARAAVSVTDSGGDGSMAYNSSTGVLTYTGPSASEVRAHFSAGEMIGITDGDVAIDAAAFSASSDVRFDAKLAAADTGDLSEGSNLYYTDARVRAAVSADDDLISFNSSTGVFSTVAANVSASWDVKMAAADTGDLSEGSNLYYTDARVTTRVADNASAAAVRGHFSGGEMIDISSGEVAINAAAFSASSDVRFDAKLAAADTGDLAEGSNLYYTDTRVTTRVADNASAAAVRGHFSGGEMIDIASGEVAINAAAFSASSDVRFDAKLAAADTGDLSEGSNLYYTDARARAAISGQDGLGYNSSTGVMSFTGSTDDVSEGSNLYYTDARVTTRVADNASAAAVRGHFSAGDAIAISSGEISVDSSIAGHGLNVSSGVLSAQHSVKSIGITNADASYGMNFQSGGTISTAVTVTLPAIVSGTVGVAGDLGKVVMVKAAELSGSGKVTVACAGSSTIDGPTDTSLDIESSAGAVTLMVVSQDGNGIWAII